MIAVVVTLILTCPARLCSVFLRSVGSFRPRRLRIPSDGDGADPGFNEAKVILKTIASVLSTKYDRVLEILVIDDGSTDKRPMSLRWPTPIIPSSRCFGNENGGKADALNLGIGQAQGEVLVMIDSDTVLDHDAIGLLARHFVCPDIGAVAGNVKVGNRINLITRLQAIEYVTSQNFERIGLSRMNGMTVVPGAIGAWRRSAVMQCGGLNGFTLAEDCDLTLDIQKRGYKIAHENGAIAWTEAPATWKGFASQRFRWIYRDAPVRVRHVDTVSSPAAAWSGAVFIAQHISIHDSCSPVSPIMDLAVLWAIASWVSEIIQHPASFDVRGSLTVLLGYLSFSLWWMSALQLPRSFGSHERTKGCCGCWRCSDFAIGRCFTSWLCVS